MRKIMKKSRKILLIINIISVVFFLSFISFYDYKNTKEYAYIDQDNIRSNSYILIENENKEEIIKTIKNNNKIYIAEFSPSDKIFNNIKNHLNEELLKKIHYVHYIKPAELDKFSTDIIIRRFIRAFEERKIQFFYIPEHDKKQKIVKGIEEGLGKAKNISDVSRFFDEFYINYFANALITLTLFSFIPYMGLIYILSFLFFYNWSFTIAGVFFSYIIFFRISNKNIIKIVFYSLIFGVLLYSSGFNFDFIFKLNIIRGVKLILLGLPVVIVIKYLTKNKFDKICKSDIIIILIGVLSLFFYLVRSNNWGYVLDLERQTRDFLDQYLIARPRTKEIISYFFYFTKPIETFFGKIIWLLGKSLLPISILNTFLHFHTPIHLGVLRTINSFIIAFLILFVITGFKKIIKFRGKLWIMNLN